MEPEPQIRAQSTPSTPGKPAGTSGDHQIILNWDAPINNGGSNIVDYIIQNRIESQIGSSFVNVQDSVSASTSATISGLINGLNYVFRVRALNQEGLLSDFSQISDPIMPKGSPGAPTWFASTPCRCAW